MLLLGGNSESLRRTDDERDHAGAVTTSGLKALDELLHLPYLDLQSGVSMGARNPGRVVTKAAVRRGRLRSWKRTFFSASF